jgi:UDP-glucose:(glucosyl)LPS alpha-1,2-glucosyltransferase
MILIILPRNSNFDESKAGAIELCVHEFTLHSQFREEIVVCGWNVCAKPLGGIQYQSLKRKKLFFQSNSYAYAKAVLAYIKAHQPRMIEIHNRPLLAKYLLKRTKVPIALHMHNMQNFSSSLRQFLLKRLVRLYVVSEAVREDFLQGEMDSRGIVKIIYNGFMMPMYVPPKQKSIVFAGRIRVEKGVLPFAQALAKLLPDYPEWRAIFIGAKNHGFMHASDRYEEKVLQALTPIRAQVDYLGFCTHAETMAAMLKAEIVVVPSIWAEPFGRTALEGMAAGAALVSSARGGLAEVIANAALRIENPEDSTSIYAALQQVINDHPLRLQLQQAGRSRAEHFAIVKCTERLDQERAIIG